MSDVEPAAGTLEWDRARTVARSAAVPLPTVLARLDEAVGSVLAEPLVALTDLPTFHAAAMDGWAVAGPGPWLVMGEVLAGQVGAPLEAHQAVAIATGAPLPAGAGAVLRRERGVVEHALRGTRLLAVDDLTGLPDDGGELPAGLDVRPRGEECAAGDLLVHAGTLVTPAMVGLAAAAGYDGLPVIPPPAVTVLVLGDELLERGLPRDGRVRDALGPMVPAWVAGLGGRGNPPVRVADTRSALVEEIEDANADVLITTGSTARGPVDHLHDVLAHLGAHWLVDGVAVRPGHPMLLARLVDGRFLVGLPGNPLAAVSGLATLVAPLVASLRGTPGADLEAEVPAQLAADVTAHPQDTRLWPVALDRSGPVVRAQPLWHAGPAMLRSLAMADGLAVIPPDQGGAGSRVQVLPVP